MELSIIIITFYWLQTDPTANLEECVVSILIAIVRHSPSCANAVLKCERLIQAIVDRFTVNNLEIRTSMIKSVKLFKVSHILTSFYRLLHLFYFPYYVYVISYFHVCN